MSDNAEFSFKDVTTALDGVSKYGPMFLNNFKKFYNRTFVTFGNLLALYFYKELENTKCINTIYKNPTPLLFDIVYHKLTIVPKSLQSQLKFTEVKDKGKHENIERTIENVKKYQKEFVIDEFPYDLFKTIKRLLIIDTAGMGKSTIAKRLFREALKPSDERNTTYLPIIVELRKIKEKVTIKSIISDKFNKDLIGIDEKYIFNAFCEAEFIVLFDGFDEIPNEHKERAIEEINDFICTYPNSTYVILSRNEAELANFGNFYTFEIRPLQKKEAYELIRRYSGHSSIGEELIEKISDNRMQSIEEFLENPLLVSLLYISYSVLGLIPEKRHLFYEKVFQALLTTHDITKDRMVRQLRSTLNEDDLRRVLGFIAFHCIPSGYVELSEIQMSRLLNEYKIRYIDVKFQNSDFYYDCVTAVPVFIQEGSFRWAHKSMRDYFAATYWNRDKSSEGEILRNWFENSKMFVNASLLDLCREIDPISFSKTLVLEYLKSHIAYLENFGKLVEDELFLEVISNYKFSYSSMEYRFNHQIEPKFKANIEGARSLAEVTDYRIGDYRFISKPYYYVYDNTPHAIGGCMITEFFNGDKSLGYVEIYGFISDVEFEEHDFLTEKLPDELFCSHRIENIHSRYQAFSQVDFTEFDLEEFLVFLEQIVGSFYQIEEIINLAKGETQTKYIKYFLMFFAIYEEHDRFLKYSETKQFLADLEDSINKLDDGSNLIL